VSKFSPLAAGRPPPAAARPDRHWVERTKTAAAVRPARGVGSPRRSPPAARRDEPARGANRRRRRRRPCDAVCQVDAADPRNMPDPNQSMTAQQGADDDRHVQKAQKPETERNNQPAPRQEIPHRGRARTAPGHRPPAMTRTAGSTHRPAQARAEPSRAGPEPDQADAGACPQPDTARGPPPPTVWTSPRKRPTDAAGGLPQDVRR
jgi:hypothetical protein